MRYLWYYLPNNNKNKGLQVEILARLNPKTQNISSIGKHYGGITVADISAALAGTTAIGRLVLMLKYAGILDNKDLEALYSRIDGFAERRGWETDKLNQLTKLCLIEYCIDPLCGTCKGTKYLYTKPCLTCKGSGNGKYTMTERSQMLNVSRRTYQRKHEGKRQQIEEYFNQVLPEIEYKAKKTVIKNL